MTAKAQVTTSSLSGKVTDPDKEAIIGATVQAIHEPSGTRYGAITNIDGRYTIQGMRAGGPYSVEVSYIGYQTMMYKDVTLQLGEVYNLNVQMKESSELLEEVVVTAQKTKFASEKTGATTNISNTQIASMPSVSALPTILVGLLTVVMGCRLPDLTVVQPTSQSTVPTSTTTSV